MPDPNSITEHAGEEVQEILSKIPHWMIRWGMTFFLGLACFFLFMTWFIQYPDVVEGPVTISTLHPPVRLVSKTTGELGVLPFPDGAAVKQGEVVATIHQGVSPATVQYLNDFCSQTRKGLSIGHFNFDFHGDSLHFGAAQEAYSSLKVALQAYQHMLQSDPLTVEIQSLEQQIGNYVTLKSVTEAQANLGDRQLAIAKCQFDKDAWLFEQGAISEADLLKGEQGLIQAESKVQDFQKSIAQSSITLTDLQRQLNGRRLERETQYRDLRQGIVSALEQLEHVLSTWRTELHIKSPIDGRLSYLPLVHEHAHVEGGAALFVVIPPEQEFRGHIEVSKSGFGKLEVGQSVQVMLDKYPHREYGLLRGEVSQIALLPDADNYRVQFRLPVGMRSSYGRQLEFSPEMTGRGQVVTEEERLLTRIFHRFRWSAG